MPMRGQSDADMLKEQMLRTPMEQEQNDPKSLIDGAIERISAYAENPDQVTPETIQELLEMLQQASEALGGSQPQPTDQADSFGER